MGPTLSTQDIMVLQRQEERLRQQTKQSVLGFMFKKSKEGCLNMASLGTRSVSPTKSDETARSISSLQPPARPHRKRRPAPKPPVDLTQTAVQDISGDENKDKMMIINHSRNSSDSSGYHEASVLSDNPDSAARLLETLPRRSKAPDLSDAPRKLVQTSQSSKSLGNLAMPSETLSREISSTSLYFTGLRKKRAAPPPPTPRPISSAISAQALERIVNSEELLTSDMGPSKPSSNVDISSKASLDIVCQKINSNIGIDIQYTHQLDQDKPKSEATMCESARDIQQNCTAEVKPQTCFKLDSINSEHIKTHTIASVEAIAKVGQARSETACQDIPSETDILLQKVSDTLSNVLPTLPCTPASKPSLPLEINYTTTSMWTNNIIAVPNNCSVNQLETKADKSSELYKSCKDLSIENVLSANMSNITAANSLQDNYVSAMGDENMSIGDWEYQLPAPPSAFRDSHSPTFNTYDTVTLGSVEAFKEVASASPVAELDDAIDSSDKNPKLAKDLLNDVKMNCDQRPSSEKINLNIKRQTNKSIVKQMPAVSQQLETDSDLRKEVISELENKIETGVLVQTVNKDFDRRNMNNLSAPELAPMDNTLSNFTITTYTKQKSLFEEFEEPSDCTRNSDQRFTKTFATLSRNNASAHNYDQSNVMKSTHLINNLSRNKRTINKSEELNTNNIDCKMESKINDQGELSYKWRPINTINKNNIQRSKSYISSSKYQKEVQDINTRKHESQMKSEITGIKKATSITDLNVYSQKDNEKSSQWRNILRKEEELTKENQLQSLQVLKSILPQLKNTQQAKENVSAKDCNNALLNQRTKYKADSHKHSIRMSSISTHESCDKSECKRSQREESAKRYVYTSPPAISLGIWSERPSINVQIKTDSDCKQEKTTINSKTIVNINEMKKERGNVNYINRVSKNNIIRHKLNIDSLANKNSDELIAKKLIAHTAASNFKISNRFNAVSSYLTRNEDRAIVTGVQLKRTSTKAPREMLKSNENEVDTTPINFKELTKTFSQYPNFKQNPKYSDGSSAIPGDVQSNEMKKITNSSVKDNNHGWFTRATDQDKFSSKSQVQQNLRVRRFMSVDVNRTNCNLGLQDKIPFRCNVNNAVKINLPMPVVKGFKIPTSDLKTNNNEVNDNGLSTIDDFNKQSPKPPTMPVITGVTLKNTKTKPKSIPLVQLNPRDMLLESIRNFGGREKLKSFQLTSKRIPVRLMFFRTCQGGTTNK